MIFFSFSLCVPSYSSRSLASTLSSRYSPVTGSMSPGSASQILARKKRRGVSGLGHWMLVGSVSFSVESATQFAFFFSYADHREEAQRPHQPQLVRAP